MYLQGWALRARQERVPVRLELRARVLELVQLKFLPQRVLWVRFGHPLDLPVVPGLGLQAETQSSDLPVVPGRALELVQPGQPVLHLSLAPSRVPGLVAGVMPVVPVQEASWQEGLAV
jgi:hypothetical protein